MVVEQTLFNNNKTTVILNESIPLTKWNTVLIDGKKVDVVCVTGFNDALGIQGELNDVLGKTVEFL